jgi:hypothetical protein
MENKNPTAAAIPQNRLEVPRTALEIAVFRCHCSETSVSAVHRLAAPLAANAKSNATTDTRDRSTTDSKSEAASRTQRPSGACQYVPRRPARTSWKSLPQYGRLMSCVIRFIFAAFRVAHVSSRVFRGAGNEKTRRR